jgi:hypothetical protein
MDAAEEKEIAGVEIDRPGVLVDAEGEEIFLAEFDVRREIGLEGGVAALMKIRSSFAGLIDIDRLAVAIDLGSILHAVEIELDQTVFPVGGDIELEAIEADDVVGLVVGGGREASHLPVAGDRDRLPRVVFLVVELFKRFEFLRQHNRIGLTADFPVLGIRRRIFLFELETPLAVERADESGIWGNDRCADTGAGQR